jgi:methylphosphotriester-DNA--protein-cysteine methyltransferase
MISNAQRIHDGFIETATNWIVDPEPNEIEHLLENVDFSHRQVERLCKTYFGSGPKKLHRKFRALHAANRLTWMNLSDWREVARAAYYDQAHFIKEFKQFNGRTPQEFMNGPNILVRMTLEERLKINHGSPFSLVG